MVGDTEGLDAGIERGAVIAVGIYQATAGLQYAYALAIGAALRCARVTVVDAVSARRAAVLDGHLNALTAKTDRLEARLCWLLAFPSG